MKASKYLFLLLTLHFSLFTSTVNAQQWSAEEVNEIITKVNDTWQKNNPKHGRSFWDNAVYHTGNMEAYALLKKQEWRDYSAAWGEQNKWMGAQEKDNAKWKYKNYGEGHDYVLFGDWQICFQTYLDLFFAEEGYDYSATLGSAKNTYDARQRAKKFSTLEMKPDQWWIERAREVIGYEVNSEATDYWWWADALYMVMPVMTKMYRLTGDEAYLDKMIANWEYANSIMYDNETGLYFRDGKYVYPKHTTAHGKKDYWARGDGWVMAAFAKVLKDMPKNYKHRKTILSYYKRMAAAIKECQQREGYWTRSMYDPEQAPGRETSGTALFCYGLLWGINNKVLPAKEYLPVAEKAWQYLASTALQADNRIGYVQPIGEKAIPGQVVDRHSESNFGTGAFLLAACEYSRYLTSKGLVKKAERAVPSDSDMGAYLMVYHKDCDHGLHMAVSFDGRTWTSLKNDAPIISGDSIAVQHGIRDPHIFRGIDGAFYLAMTDLHLFTQKKFESDARYSKVSEYRDTEWERDGAKYGWGNNRGLVLMKSYDLINWTRTNLDFSSLKCPTGIFDFHGNPVPWSEVGCVWAPETVYDYEAGRLFVHFTTRMKSGANIIYYAYMNDAFTDFVSDPKPLFEAPLNHNGVPAYNVIDSDIRKVGDTYHLFYVSHEKTATVKHATSKNITGPYTMDEAYNDGEKEGHEAPNCWKLNGEERYIVMFDNYHRHPHNFGFVETTDFKTFTPIGYFDADGSPMKRVNFAEQKHGAVVPLTVAEANMLLKRFK